MFLFWSRASGWFRLRNLALGSPRADVALFPSCMSPLSVPPCSCLTWWSLLVYLPFVRGRTVDDNKLNAVGDLTYWPLSPSSEGKDISERIVRFGASRHCGRLPATHPALRRKIQGRRSRLSSADRAAHSLSGGELTYTAHRGTSEVSDWGILGTTQAATASCHRKRNVRFGRQEQKSKKRARDPLRTCDTSLLLIEAVLFKSIIVCPVPGSSWLLLSF